jgi:hypothetical protein
MRNMLLAACVMFSSCDAGGLFIVMHDAGPDAVGPIEPFDAAACGNGNGGIGIICTDPVKDCPPEDACWFFVCEAGPGETKVCAGKAKDAGPQ